MMLRNVDKIQPWERQLLLVFKEAAERSPYLNETQKRCIENTLQEVVDIWTSENFK